ncbi:MAG TPA: shikimate kinase [Mycobacteriales bacterium]
MKQVVLVGLMGSGKSTVGALVAARTGRVFVDVDIVIARETGKTVRELWEQGGEAAYRKLESDAVLRVLAGDTPSVLAAPGGVVLDPAVRAALADHFVVWLRTRPTTLAGRVHVGDHRPLLGDKPADVLTVMADERSDLYRQVATATLDTDDRAPDALADAVVGALADPPADT